MPNRTIRSTAEVVSRLAGRWVWLKTPVFPNTILTMPDSVLPWGTKNASVVEIDVDPKSLYNTGVHYQADLRVVGIYEEGTG